jgi:ArsR family transcriptional regulator, arsenate/arsenite/antimonite-responsive transcriptional repressor
MNDRQRRDRWAQIFSSLASEPRLHIIELLGEDPVECQEILGCIGLSQPAISYHLAKLERAGVVRKERQGTRNCYRLDKRLRAVVGAIMKED